MEVKNYLKLDVDKQQGDIKPFKSQCNKDDGISEPKHHREGKVSLQRGFYTCSCSRSYSCSQRAHKALGNFCGKLFRNRNKRDIHIYEAWEETSHKCSSKDKVENQQKYKVVEKADFIMKKDMENREIMRENKNKK